MFVDSEIKTICRSFDIECIHIGKLIETSKGENDRRFNYEINGDYFLKITNSKAINERVLEDISRLIERYNSIGIYAPSLVKIKEENYSLIIEKDKINYICYLEDKAIYPTFQKYKGIDYNFKKKWLEHLGVLASKFSNYDLSESKSMWSIIELTDYNDKVDEKEENFEELIKALKDNGFLQTANSLIMKNDETRKIIRNNMKELPRCVYQGDLNPSNILVDANSNFKGLIDFNMFGTEININCFLNETMYFMTIEDFDNLSGKEIFFKIKEIQENLLSAITKHYQMNDHEIAMLGHYRKIIYSSFYPNVVLMIKLLEKGIHTEKIIDFLNLIYTTKEIESISIKTI